MTLNLLKSHPAETAARRPPEGAERCRSRGRAAPGGLEGAEPRSPGALLTDAARPPLLPGGCSLAVTQPQLRGKRAGGCRRPGGA